MGRLPEHVKPRTEHSTSAHNHLVNAGITDHHTTDRPGVRVANTVQESARVFGTDPD